ncbi:MAG TPA: MYXO-CTERM sorting domain-containing protein, partial [Polyangiaceae bacterium]
PPEDYEEPWCSIMEERCETGMSEISCANLEEHCSMIGAGGSSGASGTGGSGGATGGSTTQGGAGSGSGGSPAGTGGIDAGGRASGGSAGTGSTRGGTSGTAAAGSGGDAGAPDGASGEESENGGRTVITQGCGCSVPGKRTSLPTSLLSLLAIGWFVRRRTARAAPRS